MTPVPFLDLLVGARPNYIKAAALLHAEQAASATGALPFRFRLVATGQHRAAAMSADLAHQLGMPLPEIVLTPADASLPALVHGYDAALQVRRPRAVVVVGDVTSTLAGALAAKRHGLPVFHVEAGLRSGDCTLTEEVNRVTVDHLSDLLFTTTEQAAANLRREGVAGDRIYTVGNTVIDTLLRHLPDAVPPSFFAPYGLQSGGYWLLTLHRPSNVDDGAALRRLVDALADAAAGTPVVFPIHPRTDRQLQGHALPSTFFTVPPQGYREFIYLLHHSAGILTDSGGVSEEATVLQKPCAVLRPNTERPETIEQGRSALAAMDAPLLRNLFQRSQNAAAPLKTGIPLWDGKAAPRILDHVRDWVLTHP